MASLKVFGSRQHLERVLERWPRIRPVGGHTSVVFAEPTQDIRDLYATLVTEYKFTPLDTTIPDEPTKAPSRLPVNVKPEAEYTFIPQFAGG